MIDKMNPIKKIRYTLQVGFFICTLPLSTSSISKSETHNILNFKTAIKAAQLYDPWLVGNQHSQDALESLSIAANILPDPKVSIGLANIATDSFDFNQEGMTQFKINVAQMFPRGNSLAIKQKQLKLLSEQNPYLRKNRKAEITVTVSKLWLNAYLAQESIRLIEKDRALFEQLADVAQANYSSTTGKTRQQDIIRAQLELTRLDDRLTKLKQKQEVSLQQLSKWLSGYFSKHYTENKSPVSFTQPSRFTLATKLPKIRMLQPTLYTATTEANPQRLFEYFSNHPAVSALEQKIKASDAGVDLVKQNYKPAWGVYAGYSFRGDTAQGNNRSDLFSTGITFDIPFFTPKRQDEQVQAAISSTEKLKTEKWLLLRKFISAFETTRVQLLRLNQRQQLYQNRLLPQIHQQAEASLTAYTNDDGDFAEVVRARIAELNAEIDALQIDIEQQKNIIQLNYFFMQNADDIIISEQASGDVQ